MDLGTYKSIDAEIWSGDRFWGDTKSYRSDFSGLFSHFGQILDFDPLENCEKSKFQDLPQYNFVSP